MNEFLRFYGEHHISPVSQDISDFNAHLQRRKRLYELVGIHPFAFRNASILEVGAGSGYNTLLFLHLGAQVDIVEPNAAGREQMQKLFTEHNIPKEQYRIYPCTLQDYKSEKIYDFVIAEGFLPWLSEKEAREVVQSLYAATKKDGAVVVTSMCEFSYFFEDLRRILGFALIKGVKDFEQKVSLLASAFSSHLLHLKFASRPIRDWVIDNILNPASNIANPHSIATCIKLFRQVAGGGQEPPKTGSASKSHTNTESIELLGSSPNMIGNLSWYKDMSYSYADTFCHEFERFRHILLCTRFAYSWRENGRNERLYERLVAFRASIAAYLSCKAELPAICAILDSILAENEDLGDFFLQSVRECVAALRDEAHLSVQGIANMPTFSQAWGRGQQYISFVKR